jgi:tol-pal system protein YbgF
MIIVLLSGCAVTKQDIDDINARLETQEQKIAHLEELINQFSATPEATQEQDMQIVNQLQALNNRLSVLETNSGSRNIQPNRDYVKPTITVVDASSDKGSTDIVALYQEARNHYQTKDYPVAIRTFQSIIEQAPNHDLAGNAQYWIGESYYALADFSAARMAFQHVQENYPNSNKFVDSQLKIAMTWIQQNKKDQARSILQAIKRDFPQYQNMKLVDQNLRLTQ